MLTYKFIGYDVHKVFIMNIGSKGGREEKEEQRDHINRKQQPAELNPTMPIITLNMNKY